MRRLRERGPEVMFSSLHGGKGLLLTAAAGPHFVAGDVSDNDAVERIVTEATRRLGGLDGLVMRSA